MLKWKNFAIICTNFVKVQKAQRISPSLFCKVFCQKVLTNSDLFSIIMPVHRGLVQSVEHRSPKPSVVGSSPPAPAKNKEP